MDILKSIIYQHLSFLFTLSGYFFFFCSLLSIGVLKHWIGDRDFIDYVIYIFAGVLTIIV